MRVILASNNAKKLIEMREILSGLGIEVISQREAGCDFEVEETGTTFAENARLKAKAVTDATGEIAVADDSGLSVDALDGAPGVYSARFTGSHEDTDENRNAYLLEKLAGVSNRSARFVSSICCTFPDGSEIRTEGVCEGTILLAPEGEGGFGYDPIFQPLGYSCSMGCLTAEEKNSISHRGKSLRKFADEMRKYYADK